MTTKNAFGRLAYPVNWDEMLHIRKLAMMRYRLRCHKFVS